MSDEMKSAPVGVADLIERLEKHAAAWPSVYASDRQNVALLRQAATTLAQQPAADGGFSAADMMDARQEGRKEAQQPAALAKHQPCGCVICTCEDEKQCQGCGAKHCGKHPIAEFASPVFAQQPAAVDEASAWKPISEAPAGKLCIVGWQVVEAGEYPDRHAFDYIEDGRWVHHDESVDYAAAVAPGGSKMPAEDPPYQWFIEVPAFPDTAAQQGGRR